MILKVLNPNGFDSFFQGEWITCSKFECKSPYPGVENILDPATRFDQKTMIKGRWFRISVLKREDTEENAFVVFTNCVAYLMNDAGKTIERL